MVLVVLVLPELGLPAAVVREAGAEVSVAAVEGVLAVVDSAAGAVAAVLAAADAEQAVLVGVEIAGSATELPGSASNFGNRAGRGRQNTIRGSVFFTLGNSVLDAKQFSISGAEVAKPSFGSGRFGLTVGGPLILKHLVHDEKTFFFLTYNGKRSRAATDQWSTLPTAAGTGG